MCSPERVNNIICIQQFMLLIYPAHNDLSGYKFFCLFVFWHLYKSKFHGRKAFSWTLLILELRTPSVQRTIQINLPHHSPGTVYIPCTKPHRFFFKEEVVTWQLPSWWSPLQKKKVQLKEAGRWKVPQGGKGQHRSHGQTGSMNCCGCHSCSCLLFHRLRSGTSLLAQCSESMRPKLCDKYLSSQPIFFRRKK